MEEINIARDLLTSCRINGKKAEIVANWLERAIWHKSCITSPQFENRKKLPENGKKYHSAENYSM